MPLFSLKPFWMILGAAHSKHHILFPLISFIKYVLLSSWSLVLLFIHNSASSKPHSHLCNGCHRNVCMCVHICVDKMCVCVWLGKLHPPPPACLPSSVKERMRLEREEATRLLEEETEVRPYALPVLTARIRAPGAKHRTCCHREHEQMSHIRTSEL